jgi:hypothetical protein
MREGGEEVMFDEAAYQRKWRLAHPGKSKEYNAKYRAAHRKEIKERFKLWCQEHREQCLAQDHKYYETHKARVLAYAKAWQKRNRAKCRLFQSTYRAKLPDSFMRAMLTCKSNLRAKDIPKSLCEVQRENLKLKRLLHGNGKNSTTTETD